MSHEGAIGSSPMVYGAVEGLAGLALLWFRDIHSTRLSLTWVTTEFRDLLPFLAAFAAIVVFVLPALPQLPPNAGPKNPPDFMFATCWYYLPKAADILFQQVFVASLIRSADRLGLSLPTITLGNAAMFGGQHLMLNLDGFTMLYVTRFTAAATVFGLIVPYLYLRLTNGFRSAYGIHLSFYAVDATITHFQLGIS